MCVRIGMEDLAANALIELVRTSDNSRFVSYFLSMFIRQTMTKSSLLD